MTWPAAPRDLLGAALLGCALRLGFGPGTSILSPVLLLVLPAIALDWKSFGATVPARWVELCLFAAALICLALPMASAPAFALLLLAALAALQGRPTGTGLAGLLLGLGLWDLAGRVFGQLVTPIILSGEANLAAALGRVLGLDAVADGAIILLADDRALLILRGCSLAALSWPLSLAALALSRLSHPAKSPPLIAFLLPILLLGLLNQARLVVMLFSPEMVDLLHAPGPSAMLEVLFLMPAATILLWRRR